MGTCISQKYLLVHVKEEKGGRKRKREGKGRGGKGGREEEAGGLREDERDAEGRKGCPLAPFISTDFLNREKRIKMVEREKDTGERDQVIREDHGLVTSCTLSVLSQQHHEHLLELGVVLAWLVIRFVFPLFRSLEYLSNSPVHLPTLEVIVREADEEDKRREARGEERVSGIPFCGST